MKKTKKGQKDMELKPHFTVLEQNVEGEGVALKLRCTTGIEVNINPSLLLENAPCASKVETTATRRTMVYTADLKEFK